MRFIQWTDLDVYFNLALEEYFLTKTDAGEDYFLLWQSRNAIVVGRHQNIFEEINTDYVKGHAVQVARRLSGGGTVYHDLGNLNYSLITRYSGARMDVRALTRPIVEALDMCGVDARFSDRNDLLLDGKKISGVAQSIKGKRMMHHGTLLFHSDLDAISQALRVKDDQIRSRSVKSMRSRVTNMCDYYPDLTIEAFKSNLLNLLTESSDVEIAELSGQEREAIQSLRDEKYKTWEWIYGKSPECDIEKERQIEGGELGLQLHVKKGRIISLQISGDSVNAGKLAEIEQRLQNVRMLEGDIVAALASLDIGQIVRGLDAQDLACLIVN